jgi:hypothetical protein
MLAIMGWHPDAPHKKRVDVSPSPIAMAGHGQINQ